MDRPRRVPRPVWASAGRRDMRVVRPREGACWYIVRGVPPRGRPAARQAGAPVREDAARVFCGQALPPAHAWTAGRGMWLQKREINTAAYQTEHVTVRSGTVSNGRGAWRVAGVSMMWTCHFCDGETAPREVLEHDACRKEYDRRRSARMCVRCGMGRVARIALRARGMCVKCRNAECAPYAGYPRGNV